MRFTAPTWSAAGRVRRSPDAIALLAIASAVVLANLPALLGLFDTNPLDFRSGLVQSITHGLLSGKPTIDPSNGFTSQAIGHLAALDLLHLRLPWWNPYEATGMPLLGETQSAALFPPTLLTAIANGQLYEHMLLEFTAGVCSFRLLRRLELDRPASLAGGVAFALCGKFAWFADAGVNPLAFLPMLLLGLERAFDAAGARRPGGWGLIALAGALSVYAGFPEVAYIDTLMALAWFLWRCGCLRGGELGRFVAKSGLGAVAGTLLAAPMLVAMLDYLGHADLVTHVGSGLGSRHMPASHLPQLLMPYVFGPLNGAPQSSIWILVGGYLSAVLVLLAALGLLTPERRGLKLTLFVWGVLVFARMYDVPPLLGQILGVLPGMGQIQFYRYATAALELPVIVLAALGLQHVAQEGASRRWLLLGAPAAMAVVLVAALIARPIVDGLREHVRHGHTYLTVSMVWALGTSAVVGAAALLRAPRARATLLAAVVGLDAVVLFAVPQLSAPRQTKLDLAPVSYLQAHLGDSRFYTLKPIEPDYGSYFAIASLGVDDFPPKAYADYVHTRMDPVAQFIGFRPVGRPSAEQELVRHLRGFRSAAVRYVLAPAGEPLPTRRRGLAIVLRTPTTWIYQLAGAASYFSATGCQVSSATRASVRVDCPRRTRLIRRETWFSGWSARIDGHQVPVRRADGLFQAVTVPAGVHVVTFSFAPVGMGWALVGLLAGCALLATPGLRRVAVRPRTSTPDLAGTAR